MNRKLIQAGPGSMTPLYWAQHFEPWYLSMYKKVLEQAEQNENIRVQDTGGDHSVSDSLSPDNIDR
jgi:hypothetical protein